MKAPPVWFPTDQAEALREKYNGKIQRLAALVDLLDSEILSNPLTVLSPKIYATEPSLAYSLFHRYRLIVGSGSPNKNGPAVRFIRLALKEVSNRLQTEAAISQALTRMLRRTATNR
jgi:hypothetical protein